MDGEIEVSSRVGVGCRAVVTVVLAVMSFTSVFVGGSAAAPVPSAASRPIKATAIAAGELHTCALLETGRVKCWGHNGWGQLGLGDRLRRGNQPGEMGGDLPAVDLGAGRTATAITAGAAHTCALLDTGGVKCWGRNESGQLGLGDTTTRGDQPGEMGADLPVVDLGAGRTATAISAGGLLTCALLDNGRVKCWGDNAYGSLGLGDRRDRGDGPGEMGDDLPVVDLGTGRTATAISAGHRHTCALLDNGRVKCWGVNSFGELGLGDTQFRGDAPGQMGGDLPVVDLGPGRTATAISAGAGHTCALLDTGRVKCWGFNLGGELGLGAGEDRGDDPGEMGADLPVVDLGTGRTATAIAVGGSHTCALLDTAGVKCWGGNYYGSLGLGDTTTRGDTPGEMGGDLPEVDLGAGRTAIAITADGEHTCALLDTGRVKCWGRNRYGQLGLGHVHRRGNKPGHMAVLRTVRLGSVPT